MLRCDRRVRGQDPGSDRRLPRRLHPLAVTPETNGNGATAASRSFRTLRAGTLPYREGLALQERLVEVRRRQAEDILVLLGHPPVITRGRRQTGAHILLPAGELARRGIEVVDAGRGGDVTYHGPGQLVGYPIVDLVPFGRDLHRYLRLLEEVLIRTLAAFALRGERVAGCTGVWVDGMKIASIGVGVRRWIAWHGFALNVGGDLAGFAAIVPCGLDGVTMTSIEKLVGEALPMARVEAELVRAFAGVFDCRHAGDYDDCQAP